MIMTDLLSTRPWAAAEKYYANVAMSSTALRVPSQCHFPPVSRLSVNDKGAKDVKLGVLHRYPGIYLRAEENLS